MSKDNLMGLIIVGSLLGVGGFIMIFFSVTFGTSLAESWLMRRGGADTAYYHIIMNSYINNFLVVGGIFLSIGLLIVAFIYYKLLIIKG
jgi:hypothetical protein